MLRAVVCGARRARQGIGEYVCKYLKVAGVDICGIVSTSEKTSNETVDSLRTKYEIHTHGYLNLEEAIQEQDPDMIVICTPFRSHETLLEIVAKYNKHCLCDKPLLWDEKRPVVETVSKFSHVLLDTITQWPFTLHEFFKIYPQVKSQPIEKFSMIMSPISIGREMVLDSMPHILSMLYFLVGEGDISDVDYCFSTAEDQLDIEFTYRHTYATSVQCNFKQVKQQPKPAKYAINNCEVSRYIDTQGYKIYLCGNEDKVHIEDPLASLIKNYVQQVQNLSTTDTRKLISGARQLQYLYSVIQQENMNIK